MNIAILGYGRMGKTIEKIALDRKHNITYKADGPIEPEKLEGAEVAIDFSVPEAAYKNISTCIEKGVPVVSGTTGWLERYSEVIELCKQKNGGFLYASNFSIGMNLFFELNKKLASLMANFKEYKPFIEETHHTKKLDKPSGTAISLADQIIENSAYRKWKLVEEKNQKTNQELPVEAKRIPDVPGTHIVEYSSEIDDIEIKHTAHSRKGFALGAVLAAEWIHDKKGIFSMKNVLEDSTN